MAALLVAAAGCAGWPHWSRFVEHFVSEDGRVIDRTTDERTTSEGQAYGLFFALVADDRVLFDRLLAWTRENLAGGDLARQLPAWLWGRAPDGSWRTLDRNAASDADLWIAYTLLESARLWDRPDDARTARALLAQVLRREVVRVPGLGATLLPGPEGFATRNEWRLNPSYLPLFLLRRLTDLGAPWPQVLASSERVLRESARGGFAPDWVKWDRRRGFVPDVQTRGASSYDAIRVPLWLGLTAPDEPLRLAVSQRVLGPVKHFASAGEVPERIDTRTGSIGSLESPPGFFAALAPAAAAFHGDDVALALRDRLVETEREGLFGSPPAYYDQVLALFGEGFADGRFRFRADGRLVTGWDGRCESQ